jgi:hypothetical protein
MPNEAMKVVLLQRWLGYMTCKNAEPGEPSAGRLATSKICRSRGTGA